jgi:hypothetical protein
MVQKTSRRKSRSIYLFSKACLVTIFALAFLIQGGSVEAQSAQKTFISPETAVNALVIACRDFSKKDLMALLGPGSEPLISTGDEVDDRQNMKDFVKSYEEKNQLVTGSSGKVTLHIGKDDWPFPIPIVRAGKNWRFDTKAGKDEILNRIVGENEISAIQVCLAIADAQRDFADDMRDRTGQPEYAQRLESTKGKKDGLYWEAAQGEEPSPLGPLVARARTEGYSEATGLPSPYHGYFYKILKAQGKNAPGGPYDYVVKGRMIGGFAVVGYPASYGASGVYTFIANHDGVVYRKNLGKNTRSIAGAMTKFDPDKTWKKVK